MSNKVKSGLYFGIGMTVFFLSKTVIAWVTREEQTSSEIIQSVFAALIVGLVSGLLFGWLTDKFLISSIFTKSSTFNLDEGEAIVFQTPANHFQGTEAVGGSLCLTDKRLLFKSHKLNIQNHEFAVNLSDIIKVHKYKTLGLINNGIAIQTTNQVT